MGDIGMLLAPMSAHHVVQNPMTAYHGIRERITPHMKAILSREQRQVHRKNRQLKISSVITDSTERRWRRVLRRTAAAGAAEDWAAA
ncbi:Os10g0408360 [Oryza sativa Japonica Group]|uniref:Os10g0408360 protein n=1 Tax=Oryza sativa subsp. japonica TaxID=39947 RepID=A0A0P0XU39_ORYSJ|nr:Os10g0408360 [Oryza sativa Japonica Group]